MTSIPNTQFCDSCAAVNVHIPETLTSLANTLDALAQDLSKDGDLRYDMGTADPSIWPDMTKLWRFTSQGQLSASPEGEATNEAKGFMTFGISLARFTRNLVAGEEHNQEKAFEIEPEIRKLIHHYTSWTAARDPETFILTNLLVQTLANIVTSNESLLSSLWRIYLKELPEEEVILIRLMEFPDLSIVLSTLIFISNCVHGSKERVMMLSATSVGVRLCMRLLDGMVTLYDAEEVSDGGKAFDVGYSIFTRLIENGQAPKLYLRLSIKDEPITPHQTTLFKLIDSYLQSGTSDLSPSIHLGLAPLLTKAFFSLTEYSSVAIRKTLGLSAEEDVAIKSEVDTEPSKGQMAALELDPILPNVCEALVLVTQCIIIIALDDELEAKVVDGSPEEDLQSGWINDASSGSEAELRRMINEVKSTEGIGIIKSLIDLLRLLDLFLPRINFGEPVLFEPLAKPESQTPPQTPLPATQVPTGFAYLKRDLVRLLGILCHANKSAQDTVRESGGIPVVMGLCVIDERNPYLREHAIFTLRNLLEKNAENQAVVEAMKQIEGEFKKVPLPDH